MQLSHKLKKPVRIFIPTGFFVGDEGFEPTTSSL